LTRQMEFVHLSTVGLKCAHLGSPAVLDPENWTRVAEMGRWWFKSQEVQDGEETSGTSGVVQGEGGAGGGAGGRDSERAGVTVWRAPDAGEPVEAAAGEGGPAGVFGGEGGGPAECAGGGAGDGIGADAGGAGLAQKKSCQVAFRRSGHGSNRTIAS